jgi:hypothetical protein
MSFEEKNWKDSVDFWNRKMTLFNFELIQKQSKDLFLSNH